MSPPRLFLDAALAEGAVVDLDAAQAGYLGRVLRLKPGDRVRAFNGRDGEWGARVARLDKRGGALDVDAPLRPQRASPDAWLLFAPVKRQGTDWIVEKAVELGAARLAPVLTRRTQAEAVRLERLAAIAREAAEQCERLDLPEIVPPVSLERLLASWDPGRALAFLDEAGGGGRFEAPRPVRFAVLVGPEGGFAPEERALVRSCPAARAITLGPRILRAETAAVAGLALAMQAWGDWDAAR